MMDQYEQDPLAPGLGAMDTTPSLPPEMIPLFLPTLPPNGTLANSTTPQDPGMIFLPSPPQPELQANPVAAQMHLSLSEIPMPVFLNGPLLPMDSPQMHVPGFLPDLRPVVDPFAMVGQSEKLDLSPDSRTLSVSPPHSQIPSPSIHGTSSSYGAGVTSSLDSALDHVVVQGGRSRSNTSLSPSSIPSAFPSLSPPSANLNVAPNFEESVSHQQPQTVIGQMLKDIAITAIDAGDAFENCQGAHTTRVGELRGRIIRVLDMLDAMSVSDNEPPSFPPMIAPVPTIAPEHPNPLLPPVLPSMESLTGEANSHLAVSDPLSRKRCASALEEHRTVKALKREPQDDTMLPLAIQEPIQPAPGFTLPHPNTFPVVAAPLVGGSQSRPPSRPPTPPSAFVRKNSFSVSKQQTPLPPTFPPFLSGGSLPSSAPLPLGTSPIPPGFPHSSWSDSVVPTRHHHSLSAGAIQGPITSLPSSPTSMVPNTTFVPPILPAPVIQPALTTSKTASSTISPAIGRMSRSGSISGTNFRHAYAPYPVNEPYADTSAAATWHAAKASNPLTRNGQSSWKMGAELSNSQKKFSFAGNSAPSSAKNSPSDDDDDDDDSESEESDSGKTITYQPSSGERHTTSTAADLPPEYQFDVDRIFFEFLNKLCSNLDATDNKGEQIHQTLMAKKMQRLDESPDFRPFKFRILAFTNAFLDELAKQGYPEEKIPTKKARNYLWRQPHILRFNEDGKKAKSKGNHIWNVEARKAGEGQWEFRPFQRKLAGSPPGLAYVGLRWSWKPHVWHPQCSFKKIAVTYSSPNLPSWLSWKNGELSGIPPPDAENCQVTALAKFSFDNQDDQVAHTFTISIAPASALDGTTYSRSRRSSLASEPPKRSTSDSALFQAPQRMNTRINRADDTRVIRVLQSVAQRVTDEAESQFVSASQPKQGELQDLVKQKHVLEQTVHAYDKAISGQGHTDSRRLAVAAQHVVLQAAQTVVAGRSVGGIPTPQTEKTAIQSVSVSELTDKTQDAIARAVKMNGTASNEVDIIVTATSILKSQTPAPSGNPSPPSRTQAVVAPSRVISTYPPSNLSPLPEYA